MWGLISLTRGWTWVPCIARWILTTGPPGKTLCCFLMLAWRKLERVNYTLLFILSLPAWPHSAAHPSQHHRQCFWGPGQHHLKPAGKVPSIRLPSLARLYPHFPESLSCFFCFPPKEQDPQESGTQTLPWQPHILRNFIITRWRGRKGRRRHCLLLVLLPGFVLAVVKGTRVWGSPQGYVVKISAD